MTDTPRPHGGSPGQALRVRLEPQFASRLAPHLDDGIADRASARSHNGECA